MEFQVQKAGINGEWKTVCRDNRENYAREIYERQLKLYSIGRFRLLADDKVLAEAKATPLFSNN